jgi:[calcium/calmodulin-dependent protein kinase] kinase
VNLIEVIDDDEKDKLYLVMEYMKKGAILSSTFWKNHLDNSKNSMVESRMSSSMAFPTCLPPDIARKYFREFLLGLDYCTSNFKIFEFPNFI